MIIKNNHVLRLDLSHHIQSDQFKTNSAVVTIPSYLVNKIYKQAILAQKNDISAYGFQKDNVPLSYIEKNFKYNILEHLKEFLFRYFVISFLYEELRKQKIVFAGDPRVTRIFIEPDKDAEFCFEFTSTQAIDLEDWKFLPFKAPKRKNYKDLDKQATAFIKEESSKKKTDDKLEIGDWICFDIWLVDDLKETIFGDFKENLWIKVGDDEPSIPFQEIFLDKKKGDRFYTKSICLQTYFDDQTNGNYLFLVEIKDVLSKTYFSIDYLKDHFKLKSNKSIHQKLIEVFSFRNDLSLRRAIVEELFELFFSRFNFEAPNSAVLRQQKSVLDILQNNPDYPVYKMQKEFENKVKQLANKQVKEMILIDYLTYYEDMQASHDDIKYYLNLSNRARTKEFIYFQHPVIKANEQEYPVPAELLKQACLREKTLNYVINHLTKN